LTIVEALEPESLSQVPPAQGESGAIVNKLWEKVRSSSRHILKEQNLESLTTSDEPMFYI